MVVGCRSLVSCLVVDWVLSAVLVVGCCVLFVVCCFVVADDGCVGVGGADEYAESDVALAAVVIVVAVGVGVGCLLLRLLVVFCVGCCSLLVL